KKLVGFVARNPVDLERSLARIDQTGDKLPAPIWRLVVRHVNTIRRLFARNDVENFADLVEYLRALAGVHDGIFGAVADHCIGHFQFSSWWTMISTDVLKRLVTSPASAAGRSLSLSTKMPWTTPAVLVRDWPLRAATAARAAVLVAVYVLP